MSAQDACRLGKKLEGAPGKFEQLQWRVAVDSRALPLITYRAVGPAIWAVQMLYNRCLQAPDAPCVRQECGETSPGERQLC